MVRARGFDAAAYHPPNRADRPLRRGSGPPSRQRNSRAERRFRARARSCCSCPSPKLRRALPWAERTRFPVVRGRWWAAS